MKEYTRFEKSTSNGAGKYYVRALICHGNGTRSGEIVITSGQGEGSTIKEAQADAIKCARRNLATGDTY